MSEKQIIRRKDFNGDGIEDRVTKEWICSEQEDGPTECRGLTNVEIGTKSGAFIPVFASQFLAHPPALAPGDRVTYAPRIYAADRFVEVPPGTSLPGLRVDSYQTRTPFLSTEELLDKCRAIVGESKEKSGCRRMAMDDPQEHGLQPWTTRLPENPALVQFAYDGQIHAIPPYPIASEEVLKATEAAFTPEYLAFLRSEAAGKLPEYEQAYPQGENPYLTPFGALKALENLRRAVKLAFLEARESQLDIGQRNAVAHIKRARYFAKKHLENLGRQSPLSPEIVIGVLDFIAKTLLDASANAPSFDGEVLQAAAKVLADEFDRQPKALSGTVAYLLKEAPEQRQATGLWPFRLKHLLPVLQIKLADPKNVGGLPPNGDLFKLAEKFPDLAAPAVIAMSNRQGPDAAGGPLLERLAKSSQVRERLLAAAASPVLLGKDAIPSLLKMTRDPEGDVRLTARQALIQIPPPSPEWEAEYLKTFRKGLSDDDAKVQLFCAHTLVLVNDTEIAATLYGRLKAYQDDSLYETRLEPPLVSKPALDPAILLNAFQAACAEAPAGAACSPELMLAEVKTFIPQTMDPVASLALANTREDYFQRHKMEVGIVLPGPDGAAGETLTLTTVALAAIAKFGRPPEAADMLGKILADKRTKETDLLFATQGLFTLEGEKAIPAVIARLKKGAPDMLFALAIRAMEESGQKKYAPELYALLMHPHPEIRRLAIGALQSFDRDAILQVLLRDSRDPEPPVRGVVAEALGAYPVEPSVIRLLEMTADGDATVQNTAAASLRNMSDPKMQTLIGKAAEKDPQLKRLLENRVAGAAGQARGQEG